MSRHVVAMAIGNNAAFEETSCAEDAVGISADIIMWVKQLTLGLAIKQP